MKSILQVWREYLASINNTNFYEIAIEDKYGIMERYSDVTNLHETIDERGIWLEFDCSSQFTDKTKHVKIHGHITKEVTLK